MKKISVILTLIVISGACSSATKETVNNEIVNKIEVNSNSVVMSNANSQMIPMNGVDPDAFNRESSNTRVVNRDISNLKPTLGAQPAPDESEFETKGKPDGSFAETRTFKKHPQLLKIEKTTNGKNITFKVYLKNGKVFDVTDEQIPNFRVAAPQNILLAVGIKPNVPPASEKQPKTETQGEKDTEVKQ